VQRLKLWELAAVCSSAGCECLFVVLGLFDPEGGHQCGVCNAAQLTCWQYVSAVVTTSRRLSSTSIGRRGRWHARVGTVHVIDRAEAGFVHLGGIPFFQFPTTLLGVVWPHLFDKRQALVPDVMISGLPAHEALTYPIMSCCSVAMRCPITNLRLKSASKTRLLRSAAIGSKPCFPLAVPYLHPRRC
jgi:hypothetical protein